MLIAIPAATTPLLVTVIVEVPLDTSPKLATLPLANEVTLEPESSQTEFEGLVSQVPLPLFQVNAGPEKLVPMHKLPEKVKLPNRQLPDELL